MKRVGIIGGYSLDHIVHVDHGVRFGQPGGPGVYAALAAALVPGGQVSLVAGLPREDAGGVWDVLAAAGVDLSCCYAVVDVPRLWILDAPEGRRIVPTTVSAGEPERTDADYQLREQADVFPDRWARLGDAAAVLVSNPSRVELADLPAAPVVGIDPEQLALRDHGWAYLDACAAVAGVLFPSRSQLRQLGEEPLFVAAEICCRLGMAVVAKLDHEGAVVFDQRGGVWRIVDRGARVVDTTGAGDALAGATIAALANGIDLPRAAAIGVSAARLTISDWGPAGLRASPPGTLTQPFSRIEVTSMAVPVLGKS